jgi:hypothetical protein
MAPHLEDTPCGAAVDPQRLVQRAVKRGAVAAELSPELLLPLGVGERRRVASGPLHLGGVAGAGRRGLDAVPWAPRHHVALAPPHESPLLGPWGERGAGPLIPPGGGESSSGISTTAAREPPGGAGPCATSAGASTFTSVAAGA